jgi:acyl carrier protein
MPTVPPSPILPPPSTAGDGAALLRHSSAEVRAAYALWRGAGDPGAADAIVLAVVRDHVPDKARRATLVLEDRHALALDLGFDSMATTEMVFVFEDVFQVTITNAEIVRLRTIGDLRAFVRRRITLPPTGEPAPSA